MFQKYRIIAFDGLDRCGKSTMISDLEQKLKENGYIPFVFHLTSPSYEYNTLFTPETFDGIDKTDTNSIIQWTKFFQLFNNIKTILNSNNKTLVILDRTPFSESIWINFFKRQSKYNTDKIFLKFLSLFSDLYDKFLYVNLIVDTDILLTRIIESKEDKQNYLTAYEKGVFDPNPLHDENYKIKFMIEHVKKLYNNLELLIQSYKINVLTYKNNNLTDKNCIINDLYMKIK